MAEQSIGALWIKEGKKGKFLSGKITIESFDYQIVVFKNTYKKEGDNQPDYRIFMSKPKEERQDEPELEPF
jgi:hypothetical protein